MSICRRSSSVAELLLTGVIAACAAPAASPPAHATVEPSSPPPVTASASAALTDEAGQSPSAPTGVDAARDTCRDYIAPAGGDPTGFVDVERLTVVVEAHGKQYSGFVFSDDAGDYGCTIDRLELSGEMLGGPPPLAELVSAEQPVVVNPTRSEPAMPGQLFFWGAVAPSVARIQVTLRSGTDEQVGEATLQDGYFAAMIDEQPCCLLSYVAYDTAGNILDRGEY
jgi:hypothetical protein